MENVCKLIKFYTFYNTFSGYAKLYNILLGRIFLSTIGDLGVAKVENHWSRYSRNSDHERLFVCFDPPGSCIGRIGERRQRLRKLE